MRLILSLLITLCCAGLFGQKIADSTEVKEYNFFYSDTANGEFAYGDYEPTGIIRLEDGSLLVSTKFSISFPSHLKRPTVYDSTYFAQQKIYSNKGHSSSGSVFKLNSKFEKEWEIFFEEQRVEKLLQSSDGKIFVIREETSMKNIWISEINSEGEILWDESFHYKSQVSVADVAIDKVGAIYLLIEGEHRIPLRIWKPYGKWRVRFFMESNFYTHLAVVKIIPGYKRRWLSTLDKRKSFKKYGYKLLVEGNLVFATYTYSGIKKGEFKEGRVLGEVSSRNGKLLEKAEVDSEILMFNQGLVTITPWIRTGEPFSIFRSGEFIDSIKVPTTHFASIEDVLYYEEHFYLVGNTDFNNRDYLVLEVSSDLKFVESWTYPRYELNELKGAVFTDEGDLVIVGMCYRRMKGTSNELVTYVNIVVVKKDLK